MLVARQEITGADRQWAAQYEPGDAVRVRSEEAAKKMISEMGLAELRDAMDLTQESLADTLHVKQPQAVTLALDLKTHKIYLSSSEMGTWNRIALLSVRIQKGLCCLDIRGIGVR